MAMLEEPVTSKAPRGPAFLQFLLRAGILVLMAWGCAALWVDGPSSRPLAALLAAVFALASFGLLSFIKPFLRGAIASLLLVLILLGWWYRIAPRNDRHWQPDVAASPTAEISGDQLTVHNVRNFEYRSETDYTPRWETRTYDLAKLQGLDLFLSYWGPRAIAHTILSWQFEDTEPLAISIETRKEEGEEYSAIRGFFRQFELYYVVADERDLIRLRTNVRGEDVYLYRLRTPSSRARALLLSYLATVNRLANTPDWYNAFTHNCTTTIFFHIRDLGIPAVVHWKMFLNGYLDENLYEQGVINRSLAFDHLRERSAITSVARAIEPRAEFSKSIRIGLPERPPPPDLTGLP
jgi:hypothetical protein